GGAQAYTEQLDTYTYRPARPRSSRAVSRTARGAQDQVSTTTSQVPGSSSSGARPSTSVRSPSSSRVPGGAGRRPRWKTVTSQPRPRAAATTARPTNSVPPSISSLMPVTMPARPGPGNGNLLSADDPGKPGAAGGTCRAPGRPRAAPGEASAAGRRDVLVPDAAHGVDGAPVARAELAAQPGDVHVHGAAVTDVAVAPDGADQLVAGVHPARMRDQVGQQLELQVG